MNKRRPKKIPANPTGIRWLEMGGLLVILLGSAATSVVAEDGGTTKDRRFKILTRKADDRVVVRPEGDSTLFIVTSPSGIGRMTIERVEERWPKFVLVRLNLKGLEGLGVSNGVTSIRGSVSSREGMAHSRLWMEGEEIRPLPEAHPNWISIRRVNQERKSSKGESTSDDYFELAIPPTWFRESPKSISLSWIDFYRN